MSITISTHNGSTFDLAHNLREKWRIDQENKKWAETHPGETRIDISKEHMVLINRGSLSHVYHEIFDEALKEFNNKQIATGKKDRVIKNYLSDIRAKENSSKAAKHPAYEIITAVGSKENPVPNEVARDILLEHAKRFQERNPHLYVVCQVLHMDETAGAAPHIHTTYIPVATDQTRGMRTQNSLSAALRQQGIEGDKFSVTAQMKWEKGENEALEKLCNQYGFDVDHPQAGIKQEHLDVEEYKAKKNIEEAQKALEAIKELPAGMTVVKKARLNQLEDIEVKYSQSLPMIEQAEHDLKAAENAMKAYSSAFQTLQKDRANFDEQVNKAANNKIALLKDKALEFIKSQGLWETFKAWAQSAMEKLKFIQK